jgi:hypothetical protein
MLQVKAGRSELPVVGGSLKVHLLDRQKMVAFDADGVSRYIKNKTVLNWFRKAAERYNLSPAKQVQVAALLLNEAVEHNEGRLSLPFAKTYEQYIPLAVKHGSKVDEQTSVQIEAEAAFWQWGTCRRRVPQTRRGHEEERP